MFKQFVCFLVCIISTVYGQSPNAVERFFPLKVGNLWEYHLSSWPSIFDTLQVRTTDSYITSNGDTVYTYVANTINPIGPSTGYFFPDTAYYFIRNNEIYEWVPTGDLESTSGYSRLLFKLESEFYKYWSAGEIIHFSTPGELLIALVSTGTIFAFGKQRRYNTYSLLIKYESGFIDNLGTRWLMEGIGPSKVVLGDNFDDVTCWSGYVNNFYFGDTTDIFVGIEQGFTNNDRLVDAVLMQNYPNPFNLTSTIRFDLQNSSNIELNIFDTSGRLIKQLEKSFLPTGQYVYEWNGQNEDGAIVTTGIYLYRLQTANFMDTKKMLLIK